MFCFLLFKSQMDKQQKKVVLRPFIVLAGAMVVFFASVTLARFTTFSLDSSTNTFNSVVAYIGQPFINYNNFFNNYICSQHTFNRIMPVSHYFVLDPGWTLGDYRALIQSQTGMNIGVFYTFLGDLMVDLDKVGNATLTNHKVNLKTFSETEIVTSNYTFDIANEILTYGSDIIDLKKIIGSTNTYTKEDLVPEKGSGTGVDGVTDITDNSSGTGTGGSGGGGGAGRY